MATPDIVPRADNEGSLGTSAKKWADIRSVLMTLTGAFTGLSATLSSFLAALFLTLTNSTWASISTPASGKTAVFVDDKKRLKSKDDAGFVSGGIVNFSVASQAPAAATRTYIIGSNVDIVAGQVQAGTTIRWTFSLTKTAAGSAASTIDIAVGTAGSTSDTARVSFTKPAGTAAVDEATFVIEAVIRNAGASSVIVGQMTMLHNLAATGHATIPVVVVNTVGAAFDITTATDIGLCITSGASDAITLQLVKTEVLNA